MATKEQIFQKVKTFKTGFMKMLLNLTVQINHGLSAKLPSIIWKHVHIPHTLQWFNYANADVHPY